MIPSGLITAAAAIPVPDLAVPNADPMAALCREIRRVKSMICLRLTTENHSGRGSHYTEKWSIHWRIFIPHIAENIVKITFYFGYNKI